MILERQRLYSSTSLEISRLVKKSRNLNWKDKEKLSEALENTIYRKNRRDQYRRVGINSAKDNIISSSNSGYNLPGKSSFDLATKRAEELAKRNSKSNSERDLVRKRYKRLISKGLE